MPQANMTQVAKLTKLMLFSSHRHENFKLEKEFKYEVRRLKTIRKPKRYVEGFFYSDNILCLSCNKELKNANEVHVCESSFGYLYFTKCICHELSKTAEFFNNDTKQTKPTCETCILMTTPVEM